MALPFAGLYIGVPERALGWFPLGLGLIVEDEPSGLSCRDVIQMDMCVRCTCRHRVQMDMCVMCTCGVHVHVDMGYMYKWTCV